MIFINPSISALGQPLRKRLLASNWEDPQIPHRSRGEWHHHGSDVCGGSCVWVTVLSYPRNPTGTKKPKLL